MSYSSAGRKLGSGYGKVENAAGQGINDVGAIGTAIQVWPTSQQGNAGNEKSEKNLGRQCR